MVESAKILYQEGLLDEAKQTLIRLLMQLPQYRPALELFEKIKNVEYQRLDQQPANNSGNALDRNLILKNLEEDLGLETEASSAEQPSHSAWSSIEVNHEQLTRQQWLDLAITFYEMERFKESEYALSHIVNPESSWGEPKTDELTISALMLCARIYNLNEQFENTLKLLEPVFESRLQALPDFQVVSVYYEYAVAAFRLGQRAVAKKYFIKVVNVYPEYKETQSYLKSFHAE